MYKKRIAAVVVALTMATASFAQSDFLFEENEHRLDTARSGQLLLRVVNNNFFINYEYFGKYIEGYTLPGFTLRPTLLYYVAPNVTLEAGVHMLKYTGRDKVHKVSPYLAATWQIDPHLSLRMGNIEGPFGHDLHCSILECERQLSNVPEMGAQFRFDYSKVDGEVWVNWEHFIERGDTVPELIMGGLGVDWTPTDPENEWQLTVPFRIFLAHVGGQISDYPDTMQTYGHAQIGVDLTRHVERKFLKSYGVAVQGLFFNTFTGEGVVPPSSGWGIEPRVSVVTSFFDASVAYWHARDFYSLYGEAIYSSVADREPAYYQRDRNMLTAELNINFEPARHVRFSLGGNLYYDTDDQQADYSFGFYLSITPEFRLLTVKHRD